MAAKKKAKRTVLYSSAGKKLYAKRDAKGKFKDIQSYQRAHAADLRRSSKDEAPRTVAAAAKAPAAKKAGRKVAAKKAAAKKVAAKTVAAKKVAAKKVAAKKSPAKKK